MQPVTSLKELFGKAKGADENEAVELYELAIKQDPLNEYTYNRLMILYRKLKNYKKEVVTINKAIKAFEKHYNAKKSKSKAVLELSEKLSKSFGLVDKKGNHLYDPEPIATWKKRKAVAEQKLAKAK